MVYAMLMVEIVIKHFEGGMKYGVILSGIEAQVESVVKVNEIVVA